MYRVIITGSSGQTGRYLSEYLEGKWNCNVYCNYHKHGYDINRESDMRHMIVGVRPTHFINLAAISKPWIKDIDLVIETNITAVRTQLALIKEFSPECKYLNAGSSLELTNDTSLYAFSKRAARQIVMMYREDGIQAIQPFLFNHESPRRPEGFLTRKVSDHIKNRRLGDTSILEVGNINEFRDFSHAHDMARYIWKCVNDMPLVAPKLGSGVLRKVSYLIKSMFKESGEPCDWVGDKLISNKGEILCESIERLKKTTLNQDMGASPNLEPEFSFDDMIRDLIK